MDSTMKQCSSCKEEINKDAKKCPKCQSDLRTWGSKHPILAIILFFVLLSVVVSAFQDTWVLPTPTITASVVNSKLIEARNNIKINWYVKDDTIAPKAILEITNNTWHPIDLFTFNANLFNNADEMQLEQISWDDYFAGTSQEILLPWKKVTWTWQLSLFPHATRIGNIEIMKIHYKDTNETIE